MEREWFGSCVALGLPFSLMAAALLPPLELVFEGEGDAISIGEESVVREDDTDDGETTAVEDDFMHFCILSTTGHLDQEAVRSCFLLPRSSPIFPLSLSRGNGDGGSKMKWQLQKKASQVRSQQP